VLKSRGASASHGCGAPDILPSLRHEAEIVVQLPRRLRWMSGLPDLAECIRCVSPAGNIPTLMASRKPLQNG
jgi:hypothetical protein